MKKVLGIFAIIALVIGITGMLTSCGVSMEVCPTYSGYYHNSTPKKGKKFNQRKPVNFNMASARANGIRKAQRR